MPHPASEPRYLRRGNVRLHYRSAGQGPTLLLLHGIPDFWNGWRYQIDHFSRTYRVVAMDLRGVNLSDKPTDVRAYEMTELVRDVIGLMDHLEVVHASIVGHDWGAIIGWWTAILAPRRVARLATLSAPHPICYVAASESGNLHYSPHFRSQLVAAAPGDSFDIDQLSKWVPNAVARAELAEALARSDIECLRNFYRANKTTPSAIMAKLPPVAVPVLAMFGDRDRYIAPATYYQSATYVAAEYQLITVAQGGHYLHHEAFHRVNDELQRWLAR
jgi:pimeloyl-ACP methyl ester carboxylesterase